MFVPVQKNIHKSNYNDVVTITPYSQGNVIFGANAGQQCVATSLWP